MSSKATLGYAKTIMRLLHLDSTRATEQTAIICSWIQGKGLQTRTKGGGDQLIQHDEYEPDEDIVGSPGEEKIKEFALRSILGFLRDSYCKGEIPDGFQYDHVKMWDEVGSPFGILKDLLDMPKMDFITSPIDGSTALRYGYGGAASIVAGGPDGVFRDPDTERYLVVTSNSRLNDVSEFMNNLLGSQVISIASLISRLVHKCRNGTDRAPREITLTSMGDEHGKRWAEVKAKKARKAKKAGVEKPRVSGRTVPDLPKWIRRNCRSQKLTGSAVMAAISSYVPHLEFDVFVDEVSAVQAALIATASHAMNGDFLAIPLDDNPSIEVDRQVFGVRTFLQTSESDDVFLVATGITDSPVLRGTRFLQGNQASTESLCVRRSTRSRRSIVAQHDALNERHFRLLGREGTELYGSELFEIVKSHFG